MDRLGKVFGGKLGMVAKGQGVRGQDWEVGGFGKGWAISPCTPSASASGMCGYHGQSRTYHLTSVDIFDYCGLRWEECGHGT